MAAKGLLTILVWVGIHQLDEVSGLAGLVLKDDFRDGVLLIGNEIIALCVLNRNQIAVARLAQDLDFWVVECGGRL